ncbi:MAG: FHA domain-containing protein [Acidimicrobiia bacterium]|nr:FHA domain-containing protein [Acidimicrobiia bacterium]MYC58535.1 FHA domain-containing protein [Acidimicrobiia bacterium]MYG94293.1 FHA domain-containing protein [Acidimicrobiia bacterium]MYI30358.1 FHA domain-containing protein [Acidimicrobiia bacterium]
MISDPRPDATPADDEQVPCKLRGHINEHGANFCAACGVRLVKTNCDLQAGTSAGEPTTELKLDAELFRHPAVLVITEGLAAGSRFELSEDLVTIGRHGDSRIFLDDITVSRRHAEIYRDGLVRRVKDMGSLNGTYLNSRRVEDVGLKNGDELQVGRFKLFYQDGTGQ